jgi:hypothetical protein
MGVSTGRLNEAVKRNAERFPEDFMLRLSRAEHAGSIPQIAISGVGNDYQLGVIRYSRGHITLLDRPRLEELCCECYAAVKRESARLLRPLPQ